MRIAVVGAGVEGQAAAAYWAAHELTVYPTVASLPAPLTADLIVRSPGVRPDTLPAGPPVTSVIAEFLNRCPAPVIGVTGTKGKGTTCTAIAAILRAAGRRTHVAGNIGTPPLALLANLTPTDVVILELSSFQLMDVRQSPSTAVLVSVTPDHLNWHRDLAEYHEAKANLVAHQSMADTLVYAADDPVARRLAARSAAGTRFAVGGADFGVEATGVWRAGRRLVAADDVPLTGAHNLRNIAAAAAATWALIDGDVESIRRGITTMEPLPYRLTPAGTVAGVRYINDSLSTTPETTMAAMAAFTAPKVLILGGSTKGVSFTPLAAAVAAAEVRTALLVGAEADRLARALMAAGFDRFQTVDGDMATVVAAAADAARPGDVVLLSPACSSVGEFAGGYADRGDQFTAAVGRLGGL